MKINRVLGQVERTIRANTGEDGLLEGQFPKNSDDLWEMLEHATFTFGTPSGVWVEVEFDVDGDIQTKLTAG